MDPDWLYQHYQELQSYVCWTEEDARRVHSLAALLDDHLPSLIEDFYAEIEQHPRAHQVFTGGQEQIDRLKKSLLSWLRDLLTGPYDRDYVLRRWKVGSRHLEIGLEQVYTNVALSRLRSGLIQTLGAVWAGDAADLLAAILSLNKLLDLDLAKIEVGYQAEYICRLQRTERLATLGQIAAGVAHELRNPLNVVRSSAYFLLNARTPTIEKQVEHLQRIERNVDRADEVITTLSNFARMPSPEMQLFPIQPCLREALEDSALGANIEVLLDLEASLPLVLADRGQIRIVLGNLIRNARDAMSLGGCLTLAVRRAGDGIEIDVTDTGPGISQADLGRIMEPLYSTKARGLGLGLALSRMILDKNECSLRLVSEVGVGTTFTIILPSVGSSRETAKA